MTLKTICYTFFIIFIALLAGIFAIESYTNANYMWFTFDIIGFVAVILEIYDVLANNGSDR